MGRPPKYKTVEELQAKIDEYFAGCTVEFAKDQSGGLVFNQKGDPVVIRRNNPTVTGLALHLGFTSRQALLNYQAKKDFVDAVSRAKLRIENFIEQATIDPTIRPQGPIFLLYNFGWKSPTQNREDTTPPADIARENRDRYRKLFGDYGRPAVAPAP